MIIGRKIEQTLINKLLTSKQSEFLGVYGRRRIGKTFLIRELAPKKTILMEVVGKKDGDLPEQLYIFGQSFSTTFNVQLDTSFQNWNQAFELFTVKLKENLRQKITLFLDELSWLATPKSGLIQALDHFWNAHWCKLNNLKLIACGSAASWMLENLINAKGGLHNRLTETLHLKPLNLAETKLYLQAKGLTLSEQRILDLFLITGGVPLYLNHIKKNLSIAENINQLCFSESGLLKHEFPRLFKALFISAEESLKITKLIAQHKFGISRDQLLTKLGKVSGGGFDRRISELEAAGFIKTFIPYGKNNRQKSYRIIDEYSFFYLKWIEPELKKGLDFTKGYWQSLSKTQSWHSWAGYAFECVCLKHIEEIRNAIGLGSTGCKTGSWRHITQDKKENGAQIDLLFDRLDDAITICEIKHTQKQFTIDKQYAKNLAYKQQCFEMQTKTKKETFLVLITVNGLKPNIWSEDLIAATVSLKDLF